MGASAEWYRERYKRNREVVKTRVKAYRRRMAGTRWINELVGTARHRSKKNPTKYGVCDLDDAWMDTMRAVTECTLTGVPLVVGTGRASGEAHPLAPSLDRIDPTKGYTKANVRIVATWVNKARGRMPDHQFFALLAEAARNIGGTSGEASPVTEQVEPASLPATCVPSLRTRH